MFSVQSSEIKHNQTQSYPSTSKLSPNTPLDAQSDCFTVWEPLKLQQEWTVRRI